jgi:hypothetical protein
MRRIPLLVPTLWLLGFVALPLLVVLVLAISQPGDGVPPFMLP